MPRVGNSAAGRALVRCCWLVAGTAILLILAPRAEAGLNTLDRTIKVKGSPPYKNLAPETGEPHRVRTGGLAKAKSGRKGRRSSIAYFSQLTDPQIADEMSPLRVEKADPVGGQITAAWRPQEALGSQVFDQVIRSVNANRVSPVPTPRGAEGRARLGFAILTGDQPDNQQFNEVNWYIDVMRGNPIDPFSGKPIDGQNPCGSASPAERAALNARVAGRVYSGVQRYSDYPGRATARYQGFWDPDVGIAGGPYAEFPRYPGLMDRAQERFDPAGIRVPWYGSRGNHDGLIQGNVPANSVLFEALGTGCTKYFPSDEWKPSAIPPGVGAEIFTDPELRAKLLTGGELVPPDPDRRQVSKVEYKALHKGADNDQGYGFVSKRELKASADTASYYSFAPAKRTRFISLDTVAEGGGAAGNLDDPQYRWLDQQLDRWTSVEYRKGKLRRDSGKNKLIVVYGHHTLATMDNPTPDEEAGPCGDPPTPGCDADPRDSKPIHLGEQGPESVERLLRRYPNVILLVTGHTHHNEINAFRGDRPRGFWQVNTSSHIDFPQQSRLLEIVGNRDGTLSIFGTVVDQAAPVKAPRPTDADELSGRELASLSRRLAANDPQRDSVTEGGGTGTFKDRNVELLIKDPRRLAR